MPSIKNCIFNFSQFVDVSFLIQLGVLFNDFHLFFQKFLIYSPALRLSARKALKHPYFFDFDPMSIPQPPEDILWFNNEACKELDFCIQRFLYVSFQRNAFCIHVHTPNQVPQIDVNMMIETWRKLHQLGCQNKQNTVYIKK